MVEGHQRLGGLGDVAGGDTVEVRTSASKVVVSDGSITVLEPTPAGQQLDSEVQLESWSAGAYIGVGGSTSGDSIHYTYNETWSADERVVFDTNDEQHLELPTASAGDTFRVSTIPVQVAPDTGDVAIHVDDPSTTEPSFDVGPGPSGPGDDVRYTFVDASDGTDYVLYSVSDGIVRDSGTASSPLTLTDDDSDELLEFRVDDGGGATSGSTGSVIGSVGGAVGAGATSVGVGDPLFIGAVAALFAAVWWLSNTYGSGSVSTRIFVVGEGVIIGILALETLSPASIIGGVAGALEAVASGIGAGLETAMPLALLLLGGVAYLYFRQRGKPSKVVNFRLGRGK